MANKLEGGLAIRVTRGFRLGRISNISRTVGALSAIFFSLILWSGLVFVSPAGASPLPPGIPESVPGEMIVKFRDKPFDAQLSDRTLTRMKSMGLQHLRSLTGVMSGIHLFRASRLMNFEEIIQVVKGDPGVEYAQPNYIVITPAALRRDLTGVPLQCLLNPYSSENCRRPLGLSASKPPLKPRPSEVAPPSVDPGLNQAYGLAITRADQAWRVTPGSPNVIVGVIDSGIDYNHEDLAFNLWRNPNPGPKNDIVGYDFLSNDGQPFDDDQMLGHGSHAGGIIGAVGGNGIGTSGVSPRVALMALKSFSAYGYGTTESIVAGIGYGVDHGAKIISNSWASGKKDNPAAIDAIERARSRGVLLTFAAGNSAADDDNDATADYPAGYHIDNILAVASTDAEDQLASSSNYGLTTVLLAAPGVNIYSTLPGSKYGWESGTSMACPFAAGAAAQVWALNPTWNYLQIKNALADSVDSLPQLSGKVITGGRLNVLKAVSITLPR